MTTFYSPFGNQIGASESGYQLINASGSSANTYTLLWPVNGDIDATQVNNTFVIADLTNVIGDQVTPSVLRLNLPSTTQVSIGEAFILQNSTSGSRIDLYANATDTTPVVSVVVGQGARLTVTNNVTSTSTSWTTLTIGVGTIPINANSLAGPSLAAINNQLVVNPSSILLTVNTTLDASFRGALLTQASTASGAITVTLPSTVDGFYFHIVNSNQGVITLTPPTGVTINGATSQTVNPGESCTVVSQASTYLTVSLNRNPIFQFQQRTFMLNSANNWAVSISGTEPATILDFIIVGTPTGTPTVTLPNTRQLWLIRGIGGTGTSIDYVVTGGNTLTIPTSGTTQASTAAFTPVITNGINVIYAMGTGSGSPIGGSTFVAVAGSAANPSYTFQSDDTGLFQISNGVVGFSANGVQVGQFDSNGIYVMNIDGGLIP